MIYKTKRDFISMRATRSDLFSPNRLEIIRKEMKCIAPIVPFVKGEKIVFNCELPVLSATVPYYLYYTFTYIHTNIYTRYVYIEN